MSAALLAFALVGAAQPVTEKDAVREFAAICVDHFQNLAGMKQAAAASPRGYVLEDANSEYLSRIWRSPGLTIDYYQGGVRSSQFPECKLTADLVRPVVKRRVYDALASLPGSTTAPRWSGEGAWVVPKKGTVVAKIDAGQHRRITLSLQPLFPKRKQS